MLSASRRRARAPCAATRRQMVTLNPAVVGLSNEAVLLTEARRAR